MPRPREQIVANLEALYRESYARAGEAGNEAEMQRLDFQFRRDQLFLETVLDVRELLAGFQPAPPERGGGPPEEPSLLEQVGELRRLTRFPFGR